VGEIFFLHPTVNSQIQDKAMNTQPNKWMQWWAWLW